MFSDENKSFLLKIQFLWFYKMNYLAEETILPKLPENIMPKGCTIVQIKALHDYMIMIIVFTTANIWMFPAILGMQKKSSYCLSTAIQNEFWNFHEITDTHCGKIFIYSQFKVISLLFVWSSNLIKC